MAHRERFMQEVSPGRWVVTCRFCPKRGHRWGVPSRRTFATARECHDWWREHEATEQHRKYVSGSARQEADHYRALLAEVFGDPGERKRLKP